MILRDTSGQQQPPTPTLTRPVVCPVMSAGKNRHLVPLSDNSMVRKSISKLNIMTAKLAINNAQ